jgi:Ricin-type beta-trefoil lectin domain-like
MFLFLSKLRSLRCVTKCAIANIAVLVAVSALHVHAQQAISPGNYTITNACNGKALGLKNGKPNPWDNAVLSDKATTWQITSASDGSYILRASGTDSALQTSYERTATGTDVDLWTYWGGTSQRWLISDGGNGTYKLNFAAASTMALDAKYGGTNGETEVWLYDDNGTCAQRWQFNKVKEEGKKLLQTGWDTPPPWFIKSNIAAMQARPFDGIMIRSSGRSEVFTRTAWPDDTFARDRADLESIEWGRFTDNFVVIQSGTPSGWDWFNDADWAASEANARQFARLAKAGRLKGVLFDSEPYLANPWKYEQQPDAANHTFEQYQAKVRERGRRFMQVLQEEYPGLQMMTYFGMSLFAGKVEDKPGPEVLQARLRDDAFGMWVNFLNGMIEGAQLGTNITDGNEIAYYYLFADEYDRSAANIRNELVILVDPSLRAKYATQVNVGQATYADGVMNLWDSPRFCGYYFESDADRRKQLEHNVYHSLRSADRYAWFYNENMDWWGSKGDGVNIPAGMQQAIESARSKISSGAGLGFDLQATSTNAKNKCDTRRFLGGTINYPDGNAGMRFDVVIDGKQAGRYACTPYSGDRLYNCVFPAGSTATVTPVKEGYRFEPPSRSYGGQDKNLWSEDFTAIKQ